jgi:predicted tellurium resistance membrane protein TerC
MAQQQRHNKKLSDVLPFGKKNLQILIIGLILIVLGYIAMSQPPVNGFMSRTASVLILLFAFLIVIPYSIMHGHINFRRKTEDKSEIQEPMTNEK